jgi:hypothetical protein
LMGSIGLFRCADYTCSGRPEKVVTKQHADRSSPLLDYHQTMTRQGAPTHQPWQPL